MRSKRLRISVIGLTVGALAWAACGDDPTIASLPVADAGFDQATSPGVEVTLDGSGSFDPAEGELSYTWSLVSVPASSSVTLVREATVSALLTPDVSGDYVVSLVVGNGRRSSLADIVTVRASNTSVVADATCVGACEVTHGDTGSVSGRNSYGGSGGAFSFSWTQITDSGTCATACPGLSSCTPVAATVSWVRDNTEVAQFIAPCELGDLVFQLDVTDGDTSSSACVVLASINTPPVARATMAGVNTSDNPPSIDDLGTFTLSGGTSSDDDTTCDTSLTFQWAQLEPATPLASIASATSSLTNVTLPDVTAPTAFTFALVVSDGNGTSEDPCTAIGTGGQCGVQVLVLNTN